MWWKLLLWWHLWLEMKIITVMKIYHWDKKSIAVMKIDHWMKIYYLMKMYPCDENFFLRWKFMLVMKTFNWVDNLYLWWKFIIGTKIFYFDERFISDEIKYFTVMKCVTLNCNQWEKNFLFDWQLEFNWNLLIVMKIYFLMNIHHCDAIM